MTLKPPYRGRTLKDVPPTETFTRPRVVIVYWCSRWRPRTCVERRTDLCRARAAVCCLVLRRAGQPRRPAGAALKNSQLNISGRDSYRSRLFKCPGESSPDGCERFLLAA